MPDYVQSIANLGAVSFQLAEMPISIQSNWVDVCTAPTEADNEGSTVTTPGSISGDEHKLLVVGGVGTTVQFRLKYQADAEDPTSPTIQIFGRDANEAWQRLVDRNGDHELELMIDQENDVQVQGSKFTEPVEVDADANYAVLAAIKTAYSASSNAAATIQARVKN